MTATNQQRVSKHSQYITHSTSSPFILQTAAEASDEAAHDNKPSISHISPEQFHLLPLTIEFLPQLIALAEYQLMTHASLGCFQLRRTTSCLLTIKFCQRSVTFCCVHNLHTVTIMSDCSPGLSLYTLQHNPH